MMSEILKVEKSSLHTSDLSNIILAQVQAEPKVQARLFPKFVEQIEQVFTFFLNLIIYMINKLILLHHFRLTIILKGPSSILAFLH